MTSLDDLALENYREYLRIPSVQPDVNYDDCVTFVQNQAKSLGLPVNVYYLYPDKPIVVVTWVGQEPNLPSILLNGHMDVVPAYKEEWTYDPFAADMDDEGNIYARGAQDMKSISIQYLEAIRRMKQDNIALKRTIHVSFMPDEEIGGEEGMQAFVKSQEFKDLNVGFALDEGPAYPIPAIPVLYGEKTRWDMTVHCPGEPGHGSLLIGNTAGEKVTKILKRFYEFRAQEKAKWDGSLVDFGNVTVVNLTIVKGGVESNVIPEEFLLTFDCRITPLQDVVEFEKQLQEWCEEAGEGVWIEYAQKDQPVAPTPIDDTNPYWIAFKTAAEDMEVEITAVILPAVSDARFVRAQGIPVLGFGPMPNTPTLAHDDDEFLNKDVFLRGIEIYRGLIAAVANVSA